MGAGGAAELARLYLPLPTKVCLPGKLSGNTDRLVMAVQRLSPFRSRGPKAAVRQLREPTLTRVSGCREGSPLERRFGRHC